MSKKTRIAKELVRLARTLVAAEVNFNSTKFDGPENAIVVKKKDDPKKGPAYIYGYQITDDDIDNLKNAASREGKYEDAKKAKVGDWIVTNPDLPEKAGKIWIIDKDTFSGQPDSLYDDKPASGKTVDANYCGRDFTFEKHLANPNLEFVCFRIPDNAITHEFGGNKFTNGSYIFVKKGHCDIWERSIESMAAYEYVRKYGDDKERDKGIPSSVIEDYNQIVSKPKSNEQQNHDAE